MRRWRKLILCVGAMLLAAGCPKGGQQYNAAQKAENIQDYDTALQFYQKALATDPHNANYKIKLNQIRFEAGEFRLSVSTLAHIGAVLRSRRAWPTRRRTCESCSATSRT